VYAKHVANVTFLYVIYPTYIKCYENTCKG